MLQTSDHLHLDRLLRETIAYVHTILDASFVVETNEHNGQLPLFLEERYVLLTARVFDRHCLLMIPRQGSADTPAAIAKHRDQVRKFMKAGIVILVTSALSNHNRHRLIAHRVPFIVPGNQFYVPELGLDLREHFRADRDMPPETLTPAAQLIVLAALLGHELDGQTPTSLAHRYNYSVMSMSRAVDELHAIELAAVDAVGKRWSFVMRLSGQALWKRAAAMLRSPVRKRRRIARPSEELRALIAGESALAKLTALSEPPVEVRAIAASEWKALATRYHLDRPAGWNEEMIELETWSYDPALLSQSQTVDPLSLWLSLPDSPDERVHQAKDELLRRVGL
jgi:hypothetical protein